MISRGDYMASMREVAKESNCSIATVSRYLNNPEIVSAKKRQKIKEAIDLLEYSSNSLVKGVFMGKTDIVVVVVPSLKNPFFPRVISKLQIAYPKRPFMFFETQYDKSREETIIELALSYKAHATIIFGAINEELIRTTNRKMPIISVERDITEVASITTDSEKGINILCDYLRKYSLNDVLFIKGPIESETSTIRADTFVKNLPSTKVINEDDFTYDFYKDNIKKKMPLIACWNDSVVIKVVEELYKHNINPNDDYAVCGYDNFMYSRVIAGGVTTISQKTGVIISSIVNFLDIIDSGEYPKSIKLANESLVVRNSTSKLVLAK